MGYEPFATSPCLAVDQVHIATTTRPNQGSDERRFALLGMVRPRRDLLFAPGVRLLITRRMNPQNAPLLNAGNCRPAQYFRRHFAQPHADLELRSRTAASPAVDVPMCTDELGIWLLR